MPLLVAVGGGDGLEGTLVFEGLELAAISFLPAFWVFLFGFLARWRAGPRGCHATDRVTVDAAKLGYMCREEPALTGTAVGASPVVTKGMNTCAIQKKSAKFDLNSICDYDPDIIELLNLETGSALRRIDRGPQRPVR